MRNENVLTRHEAWILSFIMFMVGFIVSCLIWTVPDRSEKSDHYAQVLALQGALQKQIKANDAWSEWCQKNKDCRVSIVKDYPGQQ